MEEIEAVVRNSASVFDVRKSDRETITRYSAERTAFHAPGTLYMSMTRQPATYSLYRFAKYHTHQQGNKKEIKYASGIIETSLWDAMILNGMHPSLVIGLSEIYAWSIDFFGLQKGDNFKVIYEEMSIYDKPLGISRIYGASFTGSGTTIYAIPFTIRP